MALRLASSSFGFLNSLRARIVALATLMWLAVPSEDDPDVHRVDAEQWAGQSVTTLAEVLSIVNPVVP